MKSFLSLVFMLLVITGCDEKNVGGVQCGDGVLDTGEVCDGVLLGGETCGTLGFYGGALICSTSCELDTSDCEPHGFCGDTVKQDQEECEGAQLGGVSCMTLGYDYGDLACNEECAFDRTGCHTVSTLCGNGTVDTSEGEVCDGDNLNGQTCLSFGYTGGELSCNSYCELDTTACTGSETCGDGLVQTENGEECDGSILTSTCTENGYESTDTVICSPGCTWDLSNCSELLWSGFHALTSITTCAYDSHNRHYCWGSNEYGQVQDATSMIQPMPIKVTGLNLGAGDSIAAASRHSCATQSGSVFCWGRNDAGQLGRGTTGGVSTTPAPIYSSAVTGPVVAVGAGFDFSCILNSAGSVYCWGYNSSGQLGNGTYTDSPFPGQVQFPGGATAATLSVGRRSSCIVDTLGDVYCWGHNDFKNCGVNAPNPVTTPLKVEGLPAMAPSISCGHAHTCAVSQAGDVWCWGTNYQGQLGDDSGFSSDFNPHKVSLPPGTTASAVSGTFYHICALVDSSPATVYCWGQNVDSSLGSATTENPVYLPVQMILPINVIPVEIVVSYNYSCLRDTESHLYCWGLNTNGELGTGNTSNSAVMTRVVDPWYY
ncbi:hypothetical protein KKF84_22540 [Myxococcota bacterium]|nr:hypothetical protein [Myxococcota bacterium]MBU1538108.1 hypothetical protein [Myxococcota bacterium]